MIVDETKVPLTYDASKDRLHESSFSCTVLFAGVVYLDTSHFIDGKVTFQENPTHFFPSAEMKVCPVYANTDN